MIDIISRTITMMGTDGKPVTFKIVPIKVVEYLEASDLLAHFYDVAGGFVDSVDYVFYLLYSIHFPDQLDELNHLTADQIRKLISYLSGFGFVSTNEATQGIASMLSIDQIKFIELTKFLGLTFSELKNLTIRQLSHRIDLVDEIKREMKKEQQNKEAKQRRQLF